MLTETIKAVRKDQNKDKGMEDCWELSEGWSLCIIWEMEFTFPFKGAFCK